MSEPAGHSPAKSPPDQGERDEQRQEHLDALGERVEDLPDMADPKQWREAPKEGGGA
jgi:hypothetical protein